MTASYRLTGDVTFDVSSAQRSLSAWDASLEQSAARASKATTSIGSAFDHIPARAQSAGQSIQATARSADGLGSSFDGVVKSAAGFGLGMAGIASAQSAAQMAFENTIGATAKLETAVLNISTLKPEIDTSALTSGIVDMSTRVAQSTGQLADSLYNVFSSIEVSQEQALKLTEQFARGAVAAQTNAQTFGTAIIGVMNAYKLSTEDAAHVSDIFFNTVAKGVVTGSQLASSLGPVTQSAKAAGVEIEELGAFIAGVTKEGGEAGQNINNLNNLFQKITTQSAQKEINNLGVATLDAAGNFRPIQDILGDLSVRLAGMTEAARLNALQTIFPDAQARAGAQTIISQLDLVNQAIEENKTQAGSADAAYAKMASGAEAQTTILLNNLRKIGQEAGSVTLPALKELSQATVDIIAQIQKPAAEQNIFQKVFGKEALSPFGVNLAELKDNAGQTIGAVKQGYDTLKSSLNGVAPSVENMTEAQGQSTQQFEAHAAAIHSVVVPTQTLGQATQATGQSVQTAGQQAVTAAPNFSLLGQSLGITAEAAQKVDDRLGAAMKRIDELSGAVTQSELTWSRQSTALDSVSASALAMTTALNPQQLADWSAKAHEMADASGIAAPALAGIHREIDIIAAGGPNAAGALERLKTLVEQQKAPFDNATGASRAYADAQGAAAKESLGLGGALDTLKGHLDRFVNDFTAAMGKVPPVAKDAMRLTEDSVRIDLSKPGADAALSYANSFEKGLIVVEDGAGNVVKVVRGKLSEADYSPEGIAQMRSLASGIQQGEGEVVGAGASVVENTRSSLAADFSPEGINNATTYAQGILSGGGAAASNMAKVAGYVRAAADINLSAEGRNAAASFAAGLMAGISEARVAAAMLASAPADVTEQRLQIGSPSKLFRRYGYSTGQGLTLGIEDATPEAAAAAESLASAVITPLDRMSGSMRDNRAAIARLEADIARLNEQLKYAEPMSERAAAIQREIDLLEAWRGQIQAGIAVIDAEAKALEASKTAIDGAREAREKYLQTQGDTARFGAGGADLVGAITTARTENTAESGREAYAELERFIADLPKTLGPRAQEAGNYVRFLFFEALGAATPEDAAMFMGRLGETIAGFQAEAIAAVTFSAETINNAISTALFNDAMVQSIGAKAARLRTTIAEATRLSGTPEAAAVIADIGTQIASFEAEFAKLPASLRGPLLERYRVAYQQFMATPNDPAAQQALIDAVTHTTQALALFPQNLDRLRPEVRDAAMRLFGEVTAGTLTAEEARARLDGIIGLIPNDIIKKAPEVQNAARQLAQAVETGVIPAEEAIDRLNGYIETIGAVTREQGPMVQAELRRVADGFLDLGVSVDQASTQAVAAVDRIGAATQAAAATANPALAAIDAQIQALILSFQAGAISAEQFASSMNTLQAAAASAAAAVPRSAGAGSSGGGGADMAGGGPGSYWSVVRWVTDMYASVQPPGQFDSPAVQAFSAKKLARMGVFGEEPIPAQAAAAPLTPPSRSSSLTDALTSRASIDELIALIKRLLERQNGREQPPDVHVYLGTGPLAREITPAVVAEISTSVAQIPGRR